MNNQNTSINLFQIVIAIAKLVICLVLPVIGFGILTVSFTVASVNGLRMINFGMLIILLPLASYLAMLFFSIGSLQKKSYIPALVALIAEVIIWVCAASIMQNSNLNGMLELALTQIPGDISKYKDLAINTLARPGFGLLINMALSVVYMVFQFLPVGNLFGGPTQYARNAQTGSVNHGSSTGKSVNSGNRPKL